MIDWKTRIKNKTFVSSIISIGLLTFKQFSNIELPYEIDSFVDLLLTAISTLGIIIDPSTEGIMDVKDPSELENTLDSIMSALKILTNYKDD